MRGAHEPFFYQFRATCLRVVHDLACVGQTIVNPFPEDRAAWLTRHILPHEPALRRWLSRWPRSGLEIDDVVQETYAILAGRSSVVGIINPRAYCFQVARSVILAHRRSSKVVCILDATPIDEIGLPADEPSPEKQVSDRQQLAHLATAISQLPTKGRKALSLYISDDLTQREIGDRMGISENAVQKHLAKSILSLMSMLESRPHEGDHHRQFPSEDAFAGHGNTRKQSIDR